MSSPIFKNKSPGYSPEIKYEKEIKGEVELLESKEDFWSPDEKIKKFFDYPASEALDSLVDTIDKSIVIENKIKDSIKGISITIENSNLQNAIPELLSKNDYTINYDNYVSLKNTDSSHEFYEEALLIINEFESNIELHVESVNFDAIFTVANLRENVYSFTNLFTGFDLQGLNSEDRLNVIYTIRDYENETSNQWLKLSQEESRINDLINNTDQESTDLKNLEEDLIKIKNEKHILEKEMSSAGELAYVAHYKAAQSKNLLEETYHLTQYTIANNLSGSLDCIIEVIIDYLIKDGEIQLRLLQETIKWLKTAKALIGVSFKSLIINKNALINKIKSLIPPWAQNPQKELMRLFFDLKSKVTYPIYKSIENLVGTAMGSSNKLIKCVPLSQVSEVIIEQLIKAEYEASVLLAQILQFNDSEDKTYSNLIISLSEKKKAQQIYSFLGELILFLEELNQTSIDPNSYSKDAIKKFCIERGYYNYYDPDLDKIISLELDA